MFFGFLAFLALLFCFCYFLFAFLPTLIKEEGGMRRKNENRAFKEAPSQTFSLTYSTLENWIRKEKREYENGVAI
jgi:hypothetical protein